MSHTEKLEIALKETALLAARMVEKNRTMRWLARERSDSYWLETDYQHFFLDDVYINATGAKSASNQELISFVVSDDGAAWIKKHCLTPFWFWSVIGTACTVAQTLPLTEENLKDAAKILFDERALAFGTACGISGYPEGYSGPQTPWHTWDSFVRRHLWNDPASMDNGFIYDLLLMQRFVPLPIIGGRVIGMPTYQAQVIFNPLFEELACLSEPSATGRSD